MRERTDCLEEQRIPAHPVEHRVGVLIHPEILVIEILPVGHAVRRPTQRLRGLLPISSVPHDGRELRVNERQELGRLRPLPMDPIRPSTSIFKGPWKARSRLYRSRFCNPT